jgi:hypothetical protein
MTITFSLISRKEDDRAERTWLFSGVWTSAAECWNRGDPERHFGAAYGVLGS